MSHFCLHNLTLLDSVSGMPICLCACPCLSVCGSRGSRAGERVRSESKRNRGRETERERERPQEKRVFAGALVVPASLPRLQTKPTYVSPPLPIQTLTHLHTHTYIQCTVCVNRGWGSPAQGRKEEIRERRQRRGCREWRIDLWNEAFQTALSACCEKHLS